MKKYLPALARAFAAAVMAAVVLGPMPVAAAGQTYTNDIPVSTVNGPNSFDLIVVAGSTSDSLSVDTSTITVSVAAAEAFTLRFPGPNPGSLPNNGGLPSCHYVSGNNDIVVSGPKTVTFTPSATPCNAPGGHGGGGGTPPAVHLTQPNGGEQLDPGQHELILWSSGDSQGHTVRLQLSTDGGNNYSQLIAENEFDDGSYTWTVPNIDTTMARIRIQTVGSGDVVNAFDISDADFTIKGTQPPPPTVFVYDRPTEVSGAPTINVDKSLAPGQTAMCVSNTLIKLACPAGAGVNHPCRTVYYCGADSKRYVFPNPKAYFTWYADFSGVTIVSPELMASLSIGGNVTYRPGVRMIKIQGDPKVYAVSRGGVLHWVSSEAIAVRLYGSDWNHQIDDVSDAFFVNYRMGESITQ